MAAEVCKGWTPQWRIADRDIRQAYRGMHVEPGFYPLPLNNPPKDAFLQHSVNGNRSKTVFPTVREAIEKAASSCFQQRFLI